MRKKWLKSEDEFLKDNYPLSKKVEILNNINRSWCSIQSRCYKLNIKRLCVEIKEKNVEIWTTDEISFLKQHYHYMDKEILINHLKRSWSSIQNKAFLLKIKRKILCSNSTKLLDDSLESYYWLGFIMADGHFNKTNQIQINLSVKDINHLKKFGEFVEYKKEIIKPNLSINCSDIYNILVDKFKISNNKTYNPCILDNMSGDSFFSFIIGFIDGDGSINKNGYLYLKCHSSWLSNLQKMVSFLSNNKYNKGVINSEGLALITITSKEIMNNIKNKCYSLNLPILERKWSRIKISKKEKYEKEAQKLFLLFDKGMIPKNITNKISKSFILKQHKIWLLEKK